MWVIRIGSKTSIRGSMITPGFPMVIKQEVYNHLPIPNLNKLDRISSTKSNQNFQSNNQAKEGPSVEDVLKDMLKQNNDLLLSLRNDISTTQAAVKKLEVQVGQIAGIVNERTQSTHCKAITLRSGTQLVEVINPLEAEIAKEVEVPVEVEKQKEKEEELAKGPIPPTKPELEVPFPQRLKKNKKDKQFNKFLEILKKLHINIPFVDALSQMPSYVKFM